MKPVTSAVLRKFVTGQLEPQADWLWRKLRQHALKVADHSEQVHTFQRGAATCLVAGSDRSVAKARLRKAIQQNLPMLSVSLKTGRRSVHGIKAILPPAVRKPKARNGDQP